MRETNHCLCNNHGKIEKDRKRNHLVPLKRWHIYCGNSIKKTIRIQDKEVFWEQIKNRNMIEAKK